MRTCRLLLLALATGCSLLGKGNDPYDIVLRYVDWTPTAAEEADFEAAAARWESVITEGLRDRNVSVTQEEIDAIPDAADCAPIDEEVDDIVVFVRRRALAGPLAVGAVCVLDFGGTGLPMVSRVVVGETVLDGGGGEDMREAVFRHELGHALGLSPGAWNVDLNRDGELDRELLPGHEGTCPIDSELTFAGSQAAAAWQALGGTGEVPMQPGASSSDTVDGAGCVHLSEDVFGDALMSPYSQTPEVKLTPVTIGMLADMGYPVDASAADDYVLPAFRESTDTGDSGLR